MSNLEWHQHQALAHVVRSTCEVRVATQDDLVGGKIVKLRVPHEAKRSHAFGRKCRAEFVDVLEIFRQSEDDSPEAITEEHGPKTIYRVGERVTADSWDEDFCNECSNGIHFFITREEAEEWA